MKLLTQPNCWSCLPTSFAMALDITLAEVLAGVGHDGSAIAWPQLDDPERRRAFHIQEMIFLAHRLGYSVTPFEVLPNLLPGCRGGLGLNTVIIEYDFESVIRGSSGILTGEGKWGYRHAVAWSGKEVYDPNGTNYPIEEFAIETFWLIRKSNPK